MEYERSGAQDKREHGRESRFVRKPRVRLGEEQSVGFL